MEYAQELIKVLDEQHSLLINKIKTIQAQIDGCPDNPKNMLNQLHDHRDLERSLLDAKDAARECLQPPYPGKAWYDLDDYSVVKSGTDDG